MAWHAQTRPPLTRSATRWVMADAPAACGGGCSSGQPLRIPAAHGPCPLRFCSAFPFPCLALRESLVWSGIPVSLRHKILFPQKTHTHQTRGMRVPSGGIFTYLLNFAACVSLRTIINFPFSEAHTPRRATRSTHTHESFPALKRPYPSLSRSAVAPETCVPHPWCVPPAGACSMGDGA